MKGQVRRCMHCGQRFTKKQYRSKTCSLPCENALFKAVYRRKWQACYDTDPVRPQRSPSVLSAVMD